MAAGEQAQHRCPPASHPAKGPLHGLCRALLGQRGSGRASAGRALTLCLSRFSAAHHLKPLREPRRRLSHILLVKYRYLQSTKGAFTKVKSLCA